MLRKDTGELALDPFYLNTGWDKEVGRETMPFFSVAKSDRFFEAFEGLEADGEVNTVSLVFLAQTAVIVVLLLFSGDRRETASDALLDDRTEGLREKIRHHSRKLIAFEMEEYVKGCMVVFELTYGSQNAEDDTESEHRGGDGGEETGLGCAVGRLGDLDKSDLGACTDEVERDRSIHAKKGVGRIHEALLLVCLKAEDDEPEVEGCDAEEGKREEARRLID